MLSTYLVFPSEFRLIYVHDVSWSDFLVCFEIVFLWPRWANWSTLLAYPVVVLISWRTSYFGVIAYNGRVGSCWIGMESRLSVTPLCALQKHFAHQFNFAATSTLRIMRLMLLSGLKLNRSWCRERTISDVSFQLRKTCMCIAIVPWSFSNLASPHKNAFYGAYFTIRSNFWSALTFHVSWVSLDPFGIYLLRLRCAYCCALSAYTAILFKFWHVMPIARNGRGHSSWIGM